MSGAYLFRLGCLSLAVFFLVYVTASVAVAAAARWTVGIAGSMRPRSAARLLFALRMAPIALATFAVAGLCIPSYLWLEPDSAENVGAACLIAAALSVAAWIRPLRRAWVAAAKSRRFSGECSRAGRAIEIAGARVLAIEGQRTAALAGLWRPAVVVSRDVMSALTAEEFELAVAHERSHAYSRDNLKRLAALAAPEVFGLAPAFDSLDRAWMKFAERAADDRAVAGRRERALALASALVRVARLGAASRPSPVITALAAEDLAARVERLLEEPPVSGEPSRYPALAAAMAVCAAAFLVRPAALDLVHRALERLVN